MIWSNISYQRLSSVELPVLYSTYVSMENELLKLFVNVHKCLQKFKANMKLFAKSRLWMHEFECTSEVLIQNPITTARLTVS